MGEATKIQWCDHTFNPWRGCTKIAPGCANCYADTQSKRNPSVLGIWGPNGTRVVAAEKTWGEPLKWNKAAAEAGVRRRVFCASLADVFEDWRGAIRDSRNRPAHHAKAFGLAGGYCGVEGIFMGRSIVTLDDVRARLFALIDATPNLDWLLVTKRPENVRRMTHDHWTEKVPGHVSQNKGDGRRWKRRPNVWLLTSVSDQATADAAIPGLLKCRDLVPVLGVSYEPAVGPVDFRFWNPAKPQSEGEWAAAVEGVGVIGKNRPLDWLIVGGESGHGARPFDLAWARSTVRQCKAAGVACFVKQIGSNAVAWDQYADGLGGITGGGGDLPWPTYDPKGGDPNEWPEDLRVREWPNTKGGE